MAGATPDGALEKPAFLAGVFGISFALLVFQIVQTRILSVIAWYYLAFFAISVAMLGMTVGAVRVYTRADRWREEGLAITLSKQALACAFAMPASLAVQLSLITTLTLSISTLLAWGLLLAAMAVPYVFAGVTLSLALTRSPFPVGQVYAVDLLGASLGCLAVVGILDLVDAPSAILLAGAVAALSAVCFARAAGAPERAKRGERRLAPRAGLAAAALLALAAANGVSPVNLRPILVKDHLESSSAHAFERWNSYSRVAAAAPEIGRPPLWSVSPRLPRDLFVPKIVLDIDGAAGTSMVRYDGTLESIDFLRFDLVNLAYNLPGIRRAAIIGVGGGRDVLSAHLYGVPEIVGVELNPIFVELHRREPYASFSNLATIPKLELVVDDARSWFASTDQKFDLIQMSMIDTWAATGAGAFSLSENGLYTLEGWRAFRSALTDTGVLTVSRWYDPRDVNEAGRMIALGAAAVLDGGATDARPFLFVASAQNLATLVLAKQPFTASQVAALRAEVDRLGFNVLLAPDRPADSPLLREVVASRDLDALNRAAGSAFLDLTVPTDDRPFFFNQLRFANIPEAVRRGLAGRVTGGVIAGNLAASGALVVILVLSIVAVGATLLWPLRGVTRRAPRDLVAAGSAYFSLIGLGFMLAEIALLQRFSVYLGHPIYSLAVCLFSLILATGLGSLASERLVLSSAGGLALWGFGVALYLSSLPLWLPALFHATTGAGLATRVAVSLGVVTPAGFLLGFAFPTGMRLVEAVDPAPTPWFWGMNGAAGVLASVLAVMLSMAFGIRVTLIAAGLCYLALIPTALALIRLAPRPSPGEREGS